MYGLKWNPFSPEIPKEGLITNDRTDKFIWKIENLVMDGGFAMISGDPGTGKSVVLRLINDKLEGMRDLTVGALSRPQSAIADFYREVGNLFGIELKGSIRFAGFKILREKWHNHIESSLLRPVLLIDEAQEMPAPALYVSVKDASLLLVHKLGPGEQQSCRQVLALNGHGAFLRSHRVTGW